MPTMKFKLEVKAANQTIVELESRTEMRLEEFNMADYEKIIETEQFLERLFGYRFHILTI